MLKIAAVVATHNRPEMLANRSLASIALQTRSPDYLLVVDDSDISLRPANAKAVAAVTMEGTRLVYLENRRTEGASGAWNTALAQLQSTDPSVFVAILDDDDSWAETYLEQCERKVLMGGLDMVAAGLVFHRADDAEGEPLAAPDSLNVSDLLVRNTHVQGSNLFVRLRKLLEAGGFDEALASTTDRDLCIRLADLGTVKFGTTNEYLVHHFADENRPRLSTPGGEAKREGLAYFYRKYRGRMSEEQREAFVERSLGLFNCDPREPVVVPPLSPLPVSAGAIAAEPLILVAGAITSPDTTLAERILASLSEVIASHQDVTLKVVLLENGGRAPETRWALRSAVHRYLEEGIDVVVKTLEQQDADAAKGLFEAAQGEAPDRKSIALSRTMLQHYLFLEAKPLPGSVAWILDDDLVLEGLAYDTDGSLKSHSFDYGTAIRALKNSGASIVLCEVTGDPPLPALSCLRTQLVDLYHNLHRLAVLDPGSRFPESGDENRWARTVSPDYYYDLSGRSTRHLELPFWYEAEGESPTAGEAFREMVGRLQGIPGGVQVFRPLVQDNPGVLESSLEPSINRGPATLVFDLQALREFPNASPVMGGRRLRRSDMAWSLLNKHVGGREALQSRIPVRQTRRGAPGIQFDFQTMELDLLGFAFYSSLRELLAHKAEQHESEGSPSRGRHLLAFSGEEMGQAVNLFRNHLARRLAAYELNFIRIVGLVSALKPLCQPAGDEERDPWWIRRADLREDASTLRRFVAALGSTFTDARLQEFKDRVGRADAGEIEDFLGRLALTVERHRASMALPLEELARAGESHIRAVYGVGELTRLGAGEEGVVFTDGRLAYKYFHYWKAGDRERRIAFLQSLAGSLYGYRTLPDLLEVSRRGDNVVAVYPYETGSAYQGGYLEDLLTLLREARQAGLACRNIHPDNLLVTASGLRLIDYGSDLVPLDDSEFEQMCRRAFLTFRFPFRSDLKQLMTESLTNPRMPELTGLDQFRRALDARGLDQLYYRPMADLVASEGPGPVLDYGCGDGKLTEELFRRGIRGVGYDPDPDLAHRRPESTSGVVYGGRDLLGSLLAEHARFDTVVCGRVLCTIADDPEFLAVLGDLRRLVSESGTVLVAVCNPFHLATQSTELWERHLPEGYGYEDTFVHEKTVAINGNCRKEVHRSYATYERAFARAGFGVDEVIELEGADVRNLLPASDHLVFRLTPLPVPVPGVSLLIKTCHMEWRTIERQVRHLVGQLESPLQFLEKVVVVDPWAGPFARQYDRPDAEAHQEALARLLGDGVIDRVVLAPTDPDIIRATYLKWFGAEATESHSANGQQLFATLHGFDACSGDYVLQVDSDLLILRSDPNHDYLGEMVDVLRNDPGALFVPLGISGSERIPYTHEGPQGDWRVESRGCLFDRERLQSVFPVANHVEDGRFALPWHRAFDRFVADTDYRSYRGGDPRMAFIHVPNERKADPGAWLEVMESVERGHVPDAQLGSVELAGSTWDWAGPKRYEPFIFVICGRNVEPARFRRCVESLVAQEDERWGAVVVDDASTNGFGDYAQALLADLEDRVTLVRNGAWRGGLFNTWNAVANFCGDPNSVIITLDADDALIGSQVLDRLAKEYEDGADVTVGSMLRLDKEATYPVNFERSRWWDSNVWQHLRTFRKRLFDAIAVEDFKIDGEWIDLAADWAYMVPIIELASSPRHIPDLLYLYEPGEPKDEDFRRERDAVVARILAKPRYAKQG